MFKIKNNEVYFMDSLFSIVRTLHSQLYMSFFHSTLLMQIIIIIII